MASSASENGPEQRRSTRVLLRVSILLAGVDAEHEGWQTRGVTLLVNKHGARVQTEQPLVVGMKLKVIVPATGVEQDARVVWHAKPGTNDYGLELNNPGNLWGITFPPNDWVEEATTRA